VSLDYALARVQKGRRIEIVVQPQGHPTPTSTGALTVTRTPHVEHGRRARGTPGLTGIPLELVTGRAIDETGAPLAGVRLTLVASGPMVASGRTLASVTTAADGSFEAATEPGLYRLHVFAPGLRLLPLVEKAPNQWRIILAVSGGMDTVRIEAAPLADPDNPDARERARLTFQGIKVSSLPRVSPTLADLQAERSGVAHPVARQPLGSFCIRTAHCDQRAGLTVCCASNGDLTDEYLSTSFSGIAGLCQPVRECAGARAYRR
jgi:hypothetical protein